MVPEMPPGASIDMAERSRMFRETSAFCAPMAFFAEPSSTFAGALIGSTSFTLLRRKSMVAVPRGNSPRSSSCFGRSSPAAILTRRTTRSAPTQASMRAFFTARRDTACALAGTSARPPSGSASARDEPDVVPDHASGDDLARDVGGVDAVDLLDSHDLDVLDPARELELLELADGAAGERVAELADVLDGGARTARTWSHPRRSRCSPRRRCSPCGSRSSPACARR